MSEQLSVYVIVSRPLHPQPTLPGNHDWRPVTWVPSLEEAWAELDLLKEQERALLTTPTEAHPHELEYDVWTVVAAKL